MRKQDSQIKNNKRKANALDLQNERFVRLLSITPKEELAEVYLAIHDETTVIPNERAWNKINHLTELRESELRKLKKRRLSVVPQEELLPEIAVTDDAVPLPALLPPAEEHIADPVQLNPEDEEEEEDTDHALQQDDREEVVEEELAPVLDQPAHLADKVEHDMLLEAVHLPNVDRDIIPEPLFGHLEPFAWLGNEHEINQMMNAFRERLEHYVVMDREIQLSDVSQNDDSLHEGDEIPVVDTDSEPEHDNADDQVLREISGDDSDEEEEEEANQQIEKDMPYFKTLDVDDGDDDGGLAIKIDPLVGARIEVYWPAYRGWYACEVKETDDVRKGTHLVLYDETREEARRRKKRPELLYQWLRGERPEEWDDADAHRPERYRRVVAC